MLHEISIESFEIADTLAQDASSFIVFSSFRIKSPTPWVKLCTASGSLSKSREITGWYRRHRRLPKFSMGLLVRFALGIVTMVSRLVRSKVVLKLMLMTSPSLPLTTTQSPTRKGRSSNTVTAPNTLAILSFAASANASPVIPRPATMVVKSTFNASATKMEPKTTIQNRMTLSTAPMRVRSAPSNSSSSSQYSTTA